MNDEITEYRLRFARMIEDGRKVEVFTNTPEWQWYVDAVVKPTINDFTERIITGKLPTDKEDWIMRGMIQGLRLLIETTDSFKHQAEAAKEKSKELEDGLKDQ